MGIRNNKSWRKKEGNMIEMGGEEGRRGTNKNKEEKGERKRDNRRGRKENEE